MTQLSPTALEEAENALYPILNDDDWTGDRPKIIATAAITAYLAQAEKEGWVMVPRADIVEVRESMEQMDGTFDPETSNYALYHRLDVLLNPELIGYEAAQNGGE